MESGPLPAGFLAQWNHETPADNHFGAAIEDQNPIRIYVD
jgi:hypothetical protein